MNEIVIVFIAEVMRRLRSRIFLLATLGGIAGVALFVEAPVLIAHVVHTNSDDVVLAGPADLRARATALLEAHHDFAVVESVAALPQPVTLAYLAAHHHAAAALALSIRGKHLHVDVYPRDLATFDDIEFRSLVPLNLAVGTGVTVAQARASIVVAKSIHPLDAKFATSKSASLARNVAMGLTFVLYIAIILASQTVMSAVAEEKTSRIAEILIATISPINLMTGKTLAAAVVAIAQLILWATTAALLLPAASATLGAGHAATGAATSPAPLFAIDANEALAFPVFFILGYLQYATIYAAAASLVARTEDLGSVTTPMIMPVIGAFFIAQYALLEPDAPFVVACSFVPFISPFVIFTRIAVTVVPAWQIVLAAVINLLLVALCFWAAGKIYRVGMLLYGKLPTPRQIWAVLRA